MVLHLRRQPFLWVYILASTLFAETKTETLCDFAYSLPVDSAPQLYGHFALIHEASSSYFLISSGEGALFRVSDEGAVLGQLAVNDYQLTGIVKFSSEDMFWVIGKHNGTGISPVGGVLLAIDLDF